jgi:hypothetical protein
VIVDAFNAKAVVVYAVAVTVVTDVVPDGVLLRVIDVAVRRVIVVPGLIPFPYTNALDEIFSKPAADAKFIVVPAIDVTAVFV